MPLIFSKELKITAIVLEQPQITLLKNVLVPAMFRFQARVSMTGLTK
jgi:hypothetical protein